MRENVIEEGQCKWTKDHITTNEMVHMWLELLMQGPAAGGAWNWPDPFKMMASKVEKRGKTYAEWVEEKMECQIE